MTIKQRYRIERTEFHTRVYFVEAESEAEALAEYMETGEEDEEHSYHHGTPEVEIVPAID